MSMLMFPKYKERYQMLKSRNAKDWWTATFGDPLSWVILAVIADWKFISPNLLTIITFITKVAASGMIAFGNRSVVIIGAVFLQIGVLFDHMDGNLARYRNSTTMKGGFMDRILDGISVLIIFSSLSWHIYSQGNSVYYLLIGPSTASFYLIICYMYWSYAFYEHKTLGGSSKVNPGANDLRDRKISTLNYIIKGQKKLFNFNHIDYYFWISFAIIIGQPEVILSLLFVIVGYKVIDRFLMRMNHLDKLDRQNEL